MKRPDCFSFALLLFLLFFVSCEEENRPPSITILSPKEGQSFNRGQRVQVTFDVSDPDGNLAMVSNNFFDFYHVGSDLKGDPPYSIYLDIHSDWQDTGELTYALYAEDTDGLTAKDLVKIIVNADKPSVELRYIRFENDKCRFSLDLLDDGGADLSEYGICMNKEGNPTMNDKVFSYESLNLHVYGNKNNWVVNEFSTQNLNILPYQFYYAKPYLRSVEDLVGLGNELKLKVPIPSGTFTDSRDNREYKWIKLGSQTWMAENLNYGKFIAYGADYQSDNDVVEKYAYNDDQNNCNTDGGLYEWDEMMNYPGNNYEAGKRYQGICPNGWHIPSDSEWQGLLNEFRMYRNNEIAHKLKAESGWNGLGTNETEFNAISAGSKKNQYHRDKGMAAYFWSSTEIGYSTAYSYKLKTYYFGREVESSGKQKRNAYSVRCVKD